MRFEHEFTLPVPVTQAWPVLVDAERVVPCLPGATVTGVSGRDVEGKLRVRVGPITVTYQGSARFTDRDEQHRRAVISARAKEARGGGTAKATITAVLHDEGEHTRVGVRTELVLTGRLAQSGRNALHDVGARLVSRFADRITELLVDRAADADGSTAVRPGLDHPKDRDEPAHSAVQVTGAIGLSEPSDPELSGVSGAATGSAPVAATPPERADAVGSDADRPAPGPVVGSVAGPAPAATGFVDVAGGSGELLSSAGQRATRRWAPVLAALVLLVFLLRRQRHR